MLTLATIGMAVYGVVAVGGAAASLLTGGRLELWAELAQMLCGLLLLLSAAFVRVRVPGGLAAAIGALLALQALAVHSAAHFRTGIAPQVVRAAAAALLVTLAYEGSRRDSQRQL
jgi:hypothetical protein